TTASGPSAPGGVAAASGSTVTFEAPPGKMQLRVAVEGAASEVLDSEIRDIVVPDLTAPQTALATPEVFRARTARELQQLKSDSKPLPIAGREFSRTERILIRVPAYSPGTQPPQVTARLLNRAGQAMSELAVAPGPAAVPQIEVPLAA